VKERLTGAIILVALLVLLVPELLTGPESLQPARPAGVGGPPLRSYTIDLHGDADRQPAVPATAVSEQPVGQAVPEAEAAWPPAASVSPPVDDASRVEGRPMGSGADASAAAAGEQQAAAGANPGESAAPTGEDRPRSAFGPNARPQPERSASAGKPDLTTSEAAKAEAARAAAAKAEAARVAATKAEAARAAAAKAEAARVAATKAASTKAPGSKGWAVQLGVFGSRDNAERLAKQVKGSGFPVLLDETSGKDGKKLYWVRVGPEPDRAGAVALSARLQAAGHRETRVVDYP
jgi:cell division septation protein DedD